MFNMIDSNQIKCTLGKKIKELRIERGLSQDKLGEYIDLQSDSISTVERGKAFISSEALAKLCNFFNVSPTVFFTPNINIKTEVREVCIDEIKKLLPACDDKTLDNIRKILIILQNN